MATRALARRPQVRKFVKYTMASLVGTVFGQGSLAIFLYVLDWGALTANLFAVTCGAVPNYVANRYWTWQKRGKNHLWGEVVPFWAMTLLGLVLSTITVAFAERRWDAKWTYQVANIAGFALVWVAKFFVLDRVLFGGRGAGDPTPTQPATTSAGS